jgi:protein translocase SecG subunit
MSLFIFLTVVQALIAAALVGVILIQKSEGGGLGVGGSPAGFMSARGAADFLTRMTSILAGLFVILSIVLAAMAVTPVARARSTPRCAHDRSACGRSAGSGCGSGGPGGSADPLPGCRQAVIPFQLRTHGVPAAQAGRRLFCGSFS